MTFEAIEKSARGGTPVHLFVFLRQGLTWRYARAKQDVVIDGKRYVAAAIKSSEIRQTMEENKTAVTITMAYSRDPSEPDPPPTQDLGDLWAHSVPSDPVKVILMETHLTDPDHEIAVRWMGEVTRPKFADAELELECKPTSSLERARNQGPRWQRACWKTVYSKGVWGCNLIAEAIQVNGTLTAVDGNKITATAFTPKKQKYVGGTVTWTDDEDVSHRARITAYDGTTLTLDDATGLAVGAKVTAHTQALEVTGAVSEVNGLVVTGDAFASAPLNLAGGALSYTLPNGIVERDSIMAHDGDQVTLLAVPEGLEAGMQVAAKPGCDRSWDACTARGNTDNYGGAVYKPVVNPQMGQSMSWS